MQTTWFMFKAGVIYLVFIVIYHFEFNFCHVPRTAHWVKEKEYEMWLQISSDFTKMSLFITQIQIWIRDRPKGLMTISNSIIMYKFWMIECSKWISWISPFCPQQSVSVDGFSKDMSLFRILTACFSKVLDPMLPNFRPSHQNHYQVKKEQPKTTF